MTTTKDSVSRTEQKRWEGLSPFELKNELIALAESNEKKSAVAMLNAGRGNPNWLATEPREAFFLLGKFGLEESRRTWNEWETVGGMPAKDGIAARLTAFLKENDGERGASLLGRAVEYGKSKLGLDPDAFVHELADSVIGDNYPVPDRMLSCMEKVVHAYLVQEMCAGKAPAQPYDLFAVEGGTAAMCYIFNSAMVNRLLHQGDKVALMTPIFTPYLEIPRLAEFGFDVVEIQADKMSQDGLHTWQYDDAELDKLRDPDVKLLCLVNPSNPPSVALAAETRDRIAEIVRTDNPNLTIVTDDVYGTFVNGFESLMSVLPRNTIGVYSFSKYFGATGWRLGVIAVNRDNVFDEMIAGLPETDRRALGERYESISLEPSKIKFIDRLVADSRLVALNHTAGLSLPQQTQMGLFALFALLDTGGEYKGICQSIIARRLKALTHGMGVPLPDDPDAAHYYVELDLMVAAAKSGGDGFAGWLKATYEPVDILFRLAELHSIVLLNGGGFDGPEWSVRVSLANLPMDAYEQIGSWLHEVFQDYRTEYDSARGGAG